MSAEFFDKSGESVEISSNKLTFSQKNYSFGDTTYGAQVIDPQQQCVHKWKLRINQTGFDISIGIDDAQCKWCNADFYTEIYPTNYSYESEGIKITEGKETKYGQQYNKGDIIEMILDLVNNHLSYAVNEVDQGVAFRNIEKNNNNKYRLAIASSNEQSSVTLISYSKSNSDEVELNENKQQEAVNYNDSENKIIQSLSIKTNKLETEKQELQNEIKSLKGRIYDLENEKKEMEMTINALKKENDELKVKAMDLSTYKQWDHNTILLWILSLEKERYKRYEQSLRKELREQEITGEDLEGMDVNDMKVLGITSFKDKKALIASIKQLVNQNKHNAKSHDVNEGVQLAPTAYI